MSMPAFVQDLLRLPRKSEPDPDTRSLRIVHSREADEAAEPRAEARQRSLKRLLRRRRRHERQLRASRPPSKSPFALW